MTTEAGRRYPSPPWHGKLTGGEYKGRKLWWTELAKWDNDNLNATRRTNTLPRFKEEDPFWIDPPLKDGESLLAPWGRDIRYGPNPTYKGDQGCTFKEYQESLYKGSSQVRQIMEKWKISDEHPGLEYMPHPGSSPIHIRKNEAGHIMGHLRYLKYLSSRAWPQPRWFDSPLNENPHLKAFVAGKFALCLTMPISFVETFHFHYTDMPPPTVATARLFIKNWLLRAREPTAAGALWGASMSIVSDLRGGKCDYLNPIIAGYIGASMFGVRDYNMWRVVARGSLMALLGVFWTFLQFSETGLWGKFVPTRMASSGHAFRDFFDYSMPDKFGVEKKKF